jgi:aldehyde dehydrogenase (NAD+)
LELGGKSANLVFESADLEQAANWIALGFMYNTGRACVINVLCFQLRRLGQDCTCGSRLYVQDVVYDKFLSLLRAKVEATVFGDGFDGKSAGGPVV